MSEKNYSMENYPTHVSGNNTQYPIIKPGLTLLSSNVRRGCMDLALYLAAEISLNKPLSAFNCTIGIEYLDLNSSIGYAFEFMRRHKTSGYDKIDHKLFKYSNVCDVADFHLINWVEKILSQKIGDVIFIDGIELPRNAGSTLSLLKKLKRAAARYNVPIIVIYGAPADFSSQQGAFADFLRMVDYSMHIQYPEAPTTISRIATVTIKGHYPLKQVTFDCGLDNISYDFTPQDFDTIGVSEVKTMTKIRECNSLGLNNYEIMNLLDLNGEEYSKLCRAMEFMQSKYNESLLSDGTLPKAYHPYYDLG